MQYENTIKLEHILFDLHLGIRAAVKIRFINHRELEKYVEILKENNCIDETNKENIFFKLANRLVIFGKNYRVGRDEFTFIASCVDDGFDDYIQIGENKFIRA